MNEISESISIRSQFEVVYYTKSMRKPILSNVVGYVVQVVVCQQRLVEKDLSQGDMDQLKCMSPMASISITFNINIIQQQYYTSISKKEANILRVYA